MAYADRTYLALYGLSATELASFSTQQQDAFLQAASDQADSYLRKQYAVPLTAWGDRLRQVVSVIAAFELRAFRGINPEAEGILERRYVRAIEWLEAVAEGTAEVSEATDTTPDVDEGGAPEVFSDLPRGWA